MMLKIENVNKNFGGVQAIRNVSFGVEENELSSIIGPNGAGKSTLFNIITGSIKADSGRVIFKDRDITKSAPYDICLMGISRSFQLLNLFPRLTIYKNIQTAILAGQRLTLKFLKLSKNMLCDETGKLLEDIGLAEKANRLVGEISYGEQKRLEIGIALASNPNVLLLDEPTAGLSIEETNQIISLIQNITKEWIISTIVIEHKMNVIFSVSEKIRVLYEGSLIFEGTPEDAKRSDEVQRVYLGEQNGVA